MFAYRRRFTDWLARNRERIQTIGTGLFIYGAFNQIYDYGFYPFALAYWGATVGGLIAFAAHGGKTAIRAAVTASPEPVSNFAVSLGEDALAIFLVWFATQHPFATIGIVAVLLAVIVALIRLVIRALRNLFRSAEREFVR